MKRVLLGGMLRRSAFAATAALVLGSIVSAVPAQAAPSTPKILLHLMPTASKNLCTRALIADCANDAVTAGLSDGTPYYMYLLMATGPYRSAALGGTDQGLAGLQCGLTYDAGTGDGNAIDMYGWTNCATLEFTSGSWPASGGGNLITWDYTLVCQKAEVGVAGYFYVAAYTPATIQLVKRFVDNAAKVAICGLQPVEVVLELGDLGSVNFTAGGTTPGTNPCLTVPVEATTWSSIKGQYRNN